MHIETIQHAQYDNSVAIILEQPTLYIIYVATHISVKVYWKYAVFRGVGSCSELGCYIRSRGAIGDH